MVGINLDEAALARLDGAAKAAALETVEAVKTDLVSSQTMPFDTGAMQGSLHTEQFDAADESHTVLQTDGPQARRLYFHPEYNFQRGKNPNAGAAWYGPYEAGGAKESCVPFPVSWTVKMKKKQKETQDILSYHTQAAGCSDKARAKASGGRQPIEECGRTGL